jgi:O-succinylbenzoic acid--CoA ligase
MESPASLRPLTGEWRQIHRLLETWLTQDHAPALQVATSGSTGEPKRVALSAAALTASATATLTRLGGPGQWVLALPVHYVAGLQVVMRSILAGTDPIALAEYGDLAAATDALSHPRRYLALVPTQLHRMLDRPAEAGALATFDAVLLGGASAAPALLDRARAAGVRIVTTYGMSETSGGCVYDGSPLDGVQVRIDERGAIAIAGPMLFDGYVDQPAATAAVLRDGWLHTPDLGRFDATGRLEVLGRRDDVVISGGVNVPLPPVERRLRAAPSIEQVAVVGVPDAEWGTRVVAVVVVRPGRPQPALGELRDLVAATHPRSWAPQEVVFRDALPMLASGKVDVQALLREMAPTHG